MPPPADHEPNRHFSPAELQALAQAAPLTPFWKGMEIGRQDTPCRELYVIREGQILLRRKSRDGKEHALYLLGPEALFGEGSLQRDQQWLVSARAVTPGEMYVLPVARIAGVARHHPELILRILTLLSERLERAHLRVDLTTTESARARLLGLLFGLAQYHGKVRDRETWLPLRLSQAELGEMVGLARETVGRLLAELEAEGAIRREPRSGVWLRGPASPPGSGG